ncbi:MAG: hypothetical protein HXX08_06320 [Chloroflexi bacterium]|uniref:Uncharacterized protein n=1 Tax=Candidatus Chlorohelix allophototropha TaxID=3003348 RepID=A0A8T7LX78_9CHLR|nr:hypothetical protein [Chloroflexota bacterium]WJW67351.1 hypothetical protein OZ401_000613 [Chloroflexota bacterium L227-S17]
MSMLLVLTIFTPTFVFAEPSFSSDLFKTKWQRADKPINDGTANPARSWLWGPDSFSPVAGNTEPYTESPGGTRQVLYFDKARMEINNPTNSLVTNGLLVRELISGKQATGDAASITRRAADDIPVAGDPANNNGPTYASFAKIASLNNDNPSTDKTGQPVADTLDKDGNVGSNAELGKKAKYTYFDSALKHNIPDVFLTFMNQRGNVYVNGQLVNDQPILGDNPLAPWLDATGLPITDAYWGKVTLAGQAKDVLIQAFERRVLTFTPDNPPAFQVEMGNVGRHYYNWRYNQKYDAPAVTPTPVPTAPPTTTAPAPTGGCDSLPASTGGAYPFLKCGPAGMEMVVVAPMTANETVLFDITYPGDSRILGYTTAQPDGNLVISWNSSTTDQGKFTFTFTGQKSGKVAKTYIWLDKPVDKPTIIVFPNPGRLDQDITTVIVGFKADEKINILFTPPNPMGALRFPLPVTAEGSRTVLWLVREIYKGHEQYLQPGNWLIVASSVDGQRSASATITLNK